MHAKNDKTGSFFNSLACQIHKEKRREHERRIMMNANGQRIFVGKEMEGTLHQTSLVTANVI